MMTRIFYCVGIGLGWGLALVFMGMLARFMVELLMIGWSVLP